MDFVESCRRIIGIESTPTLGSRDAALFFADLCKKSGLHIEIQNEIHHDREEINVIARPTLPRPPSELLLQNHLDTVDPGPYGLWKKTGHNPFDVHIIENKIYGLGAADVKLDILCKLDAISRLMKTNPQWKIPPVLVATYGEETGMSGALKLIRKNKINARFALIGEPSNLKLITAGKGMVTVEIRLPFEEDEKSFRVQHKFSESTASQNKIFNGKPAHSSTPHLGESAIQKLFGYLGQLPEDVAIIELEGGVSFNTVPSHAFLEYDLHPGHTYPMSKKLTQLNRCLVDLDSEFHMYEDLDFNPSRPTLTVGTIHSTEDAVIIQGNCRITPKMSEEITQKWMKKIEQTCEFAGGSFSILDYKRPYRTENTSHFAQTCQNVLTDMGLDPAPTTQSSINESSLFSRVGIECISFGPGLREGNIHTPEEHVSTYDLELATEFYARLMKRFCL